MRALSIYLPKWPIRLAQRKQARRARQAVTPSGPHDRAAYLLVHTVQSKAIVALCCDPAEARGVRPGMTLAHARALLRDIPVTVTPFTPHEDAQRLRRLARWALQFTPVVTPDPPDGLLLDIHGCEHLYGGEEKLAGRIAAALERLGLPARMAIAPTFAGARAVAQYGRAHPIARVGPHAMRTALAAFPVHALRLASSTCAALAEMGVETIEQLLHLPRNELTARFGEDLCRTIDRALGDAPEQIEPIKELPCFEAAHAFDGPLTAGEVIRAVIRRLLADLIGKLVTQQLGIRVLVVELQRMQLPPVRVELELTRPSGSRGHLESLLHPKLERVNLGYGVEAVRLQATQVGRLQSTQATMWRDVPGKAQAADSTALAELLDQLVQRLGAQTVMQMQSVASYVPEQAFRRIRPPAVRIPAASRTYAAARPSRLFEVPEPLHVIALVPDGPPAWLRWRQEEHDIVAGIGPERLACPWWTHRSTQQRDYFMVQTKCGRWLWVFRDRGAGAWFIHGEWA